MSYAVVCNSQHITFEYEALVLNRFTVITHLMDRGFVPSSSQVLNMEHPLLTFLVVSFHHEMGFSIL